MEIEIISVPICLAWLSASWDTHHPRKLVRGKQDGCRI
jgi:hypothetical protein